MSIGIISKHFDYLYSSDTIPSKSIKGAKSFRPAKKEDLPFIQELENVETKFYFGPSIDLKLLFETSISPTVIEDDTDSICGFICFGVTPVIPILDQCNWLDWIRLNYNIPYIDYYNTLFVHYFVYDIKDYDLSIMRLAFKEICLGVHIVKNIVFVEPPLLEKSETLKIYPEFFKNFSIEHDKYYSKNVYIKTCKLYVFRNEKFVRPLRYRRATAEDNDTIVKILNSRYPHLRKKYGEFYVAEQIFKENSPKEYIIMERNDDEIYGVMLLNQNVDVDSLNKSFDLSLYDFLKKYDKTTQWKYMLTVKEIIPKEPGELFDLNFFGIKYRPTISGQKIGDIHLEENDLSYLNDESDSEALKSLDNILNSLSFYNDDEMSYSGSKQNFSEYWDFEKTKLTIENPYFRYSEKNILIPRGVNNVFMIELYACNEKLSDNRRLYDLLKASFSLFPNIDYCVTLINTKQSNDPFLEYFSSASPRHQCESDFGVYISNRVTILNQVIGNEITLDDINGIKTFLKIHNSKRSSEADIIFNLIQEEIQSYQKFYYIICFRIHKSLIGIGIFYTEDKLHILRKYFDLDSFVNFDVLRDPSLHGRIKYLLINPLFESNSKVIFREISRITGYKFFYYPVEDAEFKPEHLYNNLLGAMYPVAPTVVVDISKNQDYYNDDINFSLIFRSLKNSQNMLIQIDTRICCLGFDDVCQGFIRQLLFEPKYINYRFTNIYLITEPGVFECTISSVYRKIYKCIKMTPYADPNYIKRMGFKTRISCISGNIVALDRKSKTIFMRDFAKIKYDYLFLLCSLEYGFPNNLKWESCYSPSNYEVFNNALSAALCFNKISILKGVFKLGFEIIVYGSVLLTYGCISFLLEQNIPGKWIHFVILEVTQDDDLNVEGFGDQCVYNTIMNELKKAGVNIYINYRFVNMHLYKGSNMIHSITFGSRFKIITLPCRLFICFSRKSLGRHYSYVFRRSGLIIDGKLVIDENFKMNDPFIYSAGPITQYTRKLYVSSLNHMYFNNFEVGHVLADKFCSHIGIGQEEKKYDKIPRFHLPKMQRVFLPGGYQYICIHSCGDKIPRSLQSLFPFLGKNYIFERGKKRGERKISSYKGIHSEYFRIEFMQNGLARSLVCLTKEVNISLDFLNKLFVLNEKVLNNFIKQFDSGKMTDPLEFLTQPWVKVLLHPGFTTLRNKNFDMMANVLRNNELTNNIIQKHFEPKQIFDLSERDKQAIRNVLDSEFVSKSCERNIIQFINSHYFFLSKYLYCNPGSEYFKVLNND